MVACCGKSDESSTERRGVHRRSPKAKQKDDEGGVELEGVKLLQPKIHFGGEEDEPSVSSSRDDTEARQRKAAAAGGTGHIDASGEQLEWLNRAVGAAGEVLVDGGREAQQSGRETYFYVGGEDRHIEIITSYSENDL